MIFYKSKYCKIESEKQLNGLFSVVQKTKNIFGNSYEEITLKTDLTKADLQNLKKILEGKNE